MNVFWLSDDPGAAARSHHDDHCGKMILESAQLLASALRRRGVSVSGLYRDAHPHGHPCIDWVLESRANAEWLIKMARYLAFEWVWRGFNPHKSFAQLELCEAHFDTIPRGVMTPPHLAMPPAFWRDTPVDSYRTYYCGAKAWVADPVPSGAPKTYHAATWRRRGPPPWWEPYQPYPVEDEL